MNLRPDERELLARFVGFVCLLALLVGLFLLFRWLVSSPGS